MKNVIQGGFLQPADRDALESIKHEELVGDPAAIRHVIMHIDRIGNAVDASVQLGICLGLLFAYERTILLPRRDIQRLENEVYRAMDLRKAR